MSVPSGCERAFGLAWILFAVLGCAAPTRAPYAPLNLPDSSLRDDDAGLPRGIDTGRAGASLQAMVEQLKTWGADLEDPAKICTGYTHSCGIDTQGIAHCWGNNGDGRSQPPANLPPLIQIACGAAHTCALGSDGSVTCWGAGTDLKATGRTQQGQSLPPSGRYKEVTAGGLHSCAIDIDDKLVCWGAGAKPTPMGPPNFGQAQPPKGVFKSVSAGQAHTCAIALDTSEIVCWGAGDTSAECSPPDGYECGQKNVPPGKYAQVSAGEMHGCAVAEDGSIACWGKGTTMDNCGPDTGGTAFDCGQAMPPPDAKAPFVRVRAGWQYTCGLTKDYELKCWGWNAYGQTKVPKGTFSQVGSGGDSHVCAIGTDGRALCWGAGSDGQTKVPGDFPGN